MEELKGEKIHLQNSNDPEILKMHIEKLNLLLQANSEELQRKDESLQKIVAANQAIENEFKDFVNKIQKERSQQSQMLSAIQQQKGDVEARLDIFQQADHDLRVEVESYKQQLSEIKNHKEVTKERYQQLLDKYQKILYMLYQEHNKNLENQVFQDQANHLRELITQMNAQMRERIQKEQQSTTRTKVLENKLNMYVNAVGSKQQEVDQLKQQISNQNLQIASAQARARRHDDDLAALQAKLDERGKLVTQIQQALNDSYKKNEDLKAELNAEIEQLKQQLQEKQNYVPPQPPREYKPAKNLKKENDDDSSDEDLPPPGIDLISTTKVMHALEERQQQNEIKAKEEEEREKEIQRRLAEVRTMTIEDVAAQAMNLAEEDSVSFLSADGAPDSSQHIQLYNKQGQQHLETLETVVRKNEVSALVVQKFLEENSIANAEQLESKNVDELLKQIQLMEQLIKFKDLQVETLKTSLKQKEHELEEWIYKAHSLQHKIGNLEYLQQENSAVKQQLDLLTMIRKEKQRQDVIINKNQSFIDKQQK